MAHYRCTWLLCSILVLLLLSFVASSNSEQQQHRHDRAHSTMHADASPPNIILIMADDMAWADLGANWPNNHSTPFLDQLAKNSLRLTDYHSGNSVCSPSRASLLTGRLTPRQGVWQNFGTTSIGGLPTNETVLGEYFKQAGYRTAAHGKWHLGHMPIHHPSYRGFDEYNGVPWSVDMGCTDNPGADLPPLKVCPKDNTTAWPFSSSKSRVSPSVDLNTALPRYERLAPQCEDNNCNQYIVEQPVNLSTLTDNYAEADVRFIRGSVDRGAPFFLYMPLGHMHVPIDIAPRWKNSSETHTLYHDALREMDNHVRTIYQTLVNIDVINNTLFIFTSDNGPWRYKCDLAGSEGPFNGSWQRSANGGGGGSTFKFTTWEGGHRVPFLAHWPGRIKPRVSSALASHLDMVPTLLSLTNVTLPKDRSFDGMNLSPVFFDGSDAGHETLFHPDDLGHLTAVRYHQYKAFYRTYPASDGDCGGKVGKIMTHSPPLIFDLSVDLAESAPITPSQAVYDAIDAALKAKQMDIATTPRSVPDYSAGGLEDRACCNAAHIVCRCSD